MTASVGPPDDELPKLPLSWLYTSPRLNFAFLTRITCKLYFFPLEIRSGDLEAL
jgi:hypothetical protein